MIQCKNSIHRAHFAQAHYSNGSVNSLAVSKSELHTRVHEIQRGQPLLTGNAIALSQ